MAAVQLIKHNSIHNAKRVVVIVVLVVIVVMVFLFLCSCCAIANCVQSVVDTQMWVG